MNEPIYFLDRATDKVYKTDKYTITPAGVIVTKFRNLKFSPFGAEIGVPNKTRKIIITEGEYNRRKYKVERILQAEEMMRLLLALPDDCFHPATGTIIKDRLRGKLNRCLRVLESVK